MHNYLVLKNVIENNVVLIYVSDILIQQLATKFSVKMINLN